MCATHEYYHDIFLSVLMVGLPQTHCQRSAHSAASGIAVSAAATGHNRRRHPAAGHHRPESNHAGPAQSGDQQSEKPYHATEPVDFVTDFAEAIPAKCSPASVVSPSKPPKAIGVSWRRHAQW